ncbi:hypothetical protein FQN49_000314 [Arthroderma sp. PD_2]|nr:hypothetical protein FQN49_000314 [Arthroderma sp. PD_2]
MFSKDIETMPIGLPEDELKVIEKALDYTFQDDPELPYIAMHLPGTAEFPPGNTNLAQLGATVIEVAVTYTAYDTGTSYKPLRVPPSISIQAKIASIGFEIGLGRYVYTKDRRGGNISEASMASVVKALIGAVYVDSEENMRKVQDLLQGLGIYDAD